MLCCCYCMCFPTQLQHSGTLALVDILHSGFPHRLPLRAVASQLRTSLGPLVHQRRQEQEKKVEQLLAQTEQQQYTAANPAALDEELKIQRRMLETLRHCNLATARDRTLGKSKRRNKTSTVAVLPHQHNRRRRPAEAPAWLRLHVLVQCLPHLACCPNAGRGRLSAESPSSASRRLPMERQQS